MNRTTKFRIACLLLLCALSTGVRSAEEPRKILWDDLTIKLSAAENPFAAMPKDQLEALADVAALRDRKARGLTLRPDEISNEQAAVAKLEKAGVDATALLAKRDEVAAKLRARAGKVNPELDGKLVRIPGYMLPLEFSGKQVTEFLLVPWVGACIHTPPPPPNQIIHVKMDKPIEIRAMFDAVWVTGRMTTSASRKSVYITDGSSDVDVGYAIDPGQVEPYQ
jgi:hypothetical protein